MKSIKDIFIMLNIYLSIHGLGYTTKFKWTDRSAAVFAISTVLVIFNEMNKVFAIFSMFTLKRRLKRDAIILITIMLLEWILRIVFLLKQNKLNCLTRRLAGLYLSVAPRNIFKLETNLLLILLVNDISVVALVCTSFVAINMHSDFGFLDDDFSYGYIKPPYSVTVLYVPWFAEYWGSITPFIPIYFCCFCFILEITARKFKETLSQSHNLDFYLLRGKLSEILNMISDINEAFHGILVILLTVLLGRMFYNSYTIFFKDLVSTPGYTFRGLYFWICFLRFTLICVFASSASKAVADLKICVYDFPVKVNERWKHFIFISKMNESFVAFRLLDTIILEKNLILAVLGSLATYGIMIATFNSN